MQKNKRSGELFVRPPVNAKEQNPIHLPLWCYSISTAMFSFMGIFELLSNFDREITKLTSMRAAVGLPLERKHRIIGVSTAWFFVRVKQLFLKLSKFVGAEQRLKHQVTVKVNPVEMSSKAEGRQKEKKRKKGNQPALNYCGTKQKVTRLNVFLSLFLLLFSADVITIAWLFFPPFWGKLLWVYFHNVQYLTIQSFNINLGFVVPLPIHAAQ